MNKATLIKYVAKEAGLTQEQAAAAVNATFGVIADNIGEGIDISKFGSFGVKLRAARKGLNPTTKEKIEIPASLGVFFKPSKTLKDMWKNADISK